MKLSDSNTEFIIKRDTPVLEISGSKKVSESGKSLLKDTIVKGVLKKVYVKDSRGQEMPVKFIALTEKKNHYIIPEDVNMYMSHFVNADGLGEADRVGKNAIISEQGKKWNILFNYVLPVLGMAGGFYFAKRKGYDTKGIIMATAGGGLLFTTPMLVRKVIRKRKLKK